MAKIAIIGSGSWGVALAQHLTNMGNTIMIWSYTEEEQELINKKRKYQTLPDIILNENIYASGDFKEVISGAKYIIHVTPSKFTRDTFKQYKEYVKDIPIVICSKGFEKESLKTLDEVILEEMPTAKIGVLSGPSHAEEVSKNIPTVLVIASKHKEVQDMVSETFIGETMRIYTSNDVLGLELGGALKNIIAFCAGVAAGIGLGDNTFAALITRGLAEITRLGIAIGGKKESFYGLSGLGDLIVTCLSEHSRNRRAGKLIGQGYSLDDARKQIGMIIESVDNIEVAYELSKKYDVEMPIVKAVYNVLYYNAVPKEELVKLMTREKKEE